jgi:hypothetical protein
MKLTTLLLSFLLLAASPRGAQAADEGDSDPGVLDMFEEADAEESGINIKLAGELLNIWFWRNDSDFDATSPYYNAEGQSVSNVATFFKPQITFQPTDQITIFYEAELGMNYWSRHNPDQWFPGADDFMILKHREIYSRIDKDILKLTVGYQRMQDPSDLFLSHWMGAAALEAGLGSIGLRFFVGQLPDQTYEGIRTDQNNFVHDNFTWGLDGHLGLLDGALKVQAGLVGVHDSRVTRKHLTLYTPYVGGTLKMGDIRAEFYALGQFGRYENSGVNGIHQDVAAWALTGKVCYAAPFVDITLNTFALSADDQYDGNKQWGAFFYSGKNHSSSMMLTEDNLRDRYGNYDELMSSQWGSFFVNRAGLVVSDLSVRGRFPGPFTPELIVASGFTIEKANSFGSSYVGFETDLLLYIDLVEKAQAVLAAQVFFPGEAAAAFVNSTDLTATEPVYGFQIGTVIRF